MLWLNFNITFFPLLWADKSSYCESKQFLKRLICVLVSSVILRSFNWASKSLIKSFNLNTGIVSVAFTTISSIHKTTSPNAIPWSFLYLSVKCPSSCKLDAVLYNLFKQARWYIASCAIKSPLCSFAKRKISFNMFAHLLTRWSRRRDWTRYRGLSLFAGKWHRKHFNSRVGIDEAQVRISKNRKFLLS